MVGLLWMSTFGCAPRVEHTIEPYRSDLDAGAALSARAAEACRERLAPGAAQPVRVFATDGCSMFPDAEWNVSCCVEHDISYWCGGSPGERKAADRELGRCVAENTNGFLGWMMRTGVRVGGHPIYPTWYRWGYGYDYSWGYRSEALDSQGETAPPEPGSAGPDDRR